MMMARTRHSPLIVYVRANAYRHGPAIEAGIQAVRELAVGPFVPVAVTDEPAVFDSDLLDDAGAVVFMNASGTAMNDAQRERLHRYVFDGGGFAGVHFATGAEPEWSRFETLVGARFDGHPERQAQAGIIRIHDHAHPATSHLPSPWTWVEEWHRFTAQPPASSQLLLSVDDDSYRTEGYGMTGVHPVSWCDEYGSGRTWYTSLGHHASSYQDPLFRAHLWGGIDWVRREGL